MSQWKTLVDAYQGWSLNEIRSLSVRERLNWLEIAREYGKVIKNG
jgi:hypothetical protein